MGEIVNKGEKPNPDDMFDDGHVVASPHVYDKPLTRHREGGGR